MGPEPGRGSPDPSPNGNSESRVPRSIPCCLVLLLALPLCVEAQACVGSHAPRGDLALEGGTAFGGDATGNEAGAVGNLEGPLFLSLGYRYQDAAELPQAGHVGRARVGVETRIGPRLSLCMVGSGAYSWFDFDGADVAGHTLAGGPALGYPVPLGDGTLRVTPHVVAGVAYRSFSGTAAGYAAEESGTDAFLRGGLSFGTEHLWVQGTVRQLSASDAEPAFGVSVGASFR